MLALNASRIATPAQHQRRRGVTVRASAQAATGVEWPTPAAAVAAPMCPLECAAAVHEKTKCVHPGRPLSSACADCPRKGMVARMAKSKCVHPQRPISAACPDCPRKK